MFLRNDSEAINAACRAFARSMESKNGNYSWPGTKHIEAAVDAYLQARGIGDTGPSKPVQTIIRYRGPDQLIFPRTDTPVVIGADQEVFVSFGAPGLVSSNDEQVFEASHDRDVWHRAYRELRDAAEYALGAYDDRVVLGLAPMGKIHSMEMLRDTVKGGA